MPPAGIWSRIDGTSNALLSRAVSMNASVAATEAFGSSRTSVAPSALYQNGETSRIDSRRCSRVGRDVVDRPVRRPHVDRHPAPGRQRRRAVVATAQREQHRAAWPVRPPTTARRRSGRFRVRRGGSSGSARRRSPSSPARSMPLERRSTSVTRAAAGMSRTFGTPSTWQPARPPSARRSASPRSRRSRAGRPRARAAARRMYGSGVRLALRDLVAGDDHLERPGRELLEDRFDEPAPRHRHQRARHAAAFRSASSSRAPGRHGIASVQPGDHAVEQPLDDLAWRERHRPVLGDVAPPRRAGRTRRRHGRAGRTTRAERLDELVLGSIQ
jgi:hypothetical protein